MFILTRKYEEWKSQIQYGDYYKKTRDIWVELLTYYRKLDKKVVLWGAGKKGRAFLKSFDLKAEYVTALVDMDKKLQGKKIGTRHLIWEPEKIIDKKIDVVIVVNEIFYVDVYLYLQKQGFSGKVIDADRVVKKQWGIKQIIEGTDNSEWDKNTIFGHTMQDVQKVALEILEEVDRICKEHKITYVLEAGSALGVNRYGGFIPCDDDIDIAMVREDYDRFLTVAPSCLQQGFCLQKMQKGKEYPYAYAQVVKDKTCFVRPQFQKVKMHHGIHIDIAPLDWVLEDSTLRYKHQEKVRKYCKLLRTKMLPEQYESKNPFKKFIVNYEYYTLKCIPISFFEKVLYSNFTKYQSTETKRIADLCTHYKKDISFPYKWIFPPIYQEFEGKQYPVPREMEKYLDTIYDNYKELSPREDGSTKYTLVALSLEKNYNEIN